MIRRLLLTGATFAVLALVCSIASASVATREEASLAARNWVAYVTHETGAWGDGSRGGVGAPTLSEPREIVVSDTLVGWWFSVSPSGHVVVPVLKELPPVKSYDDRYGMDIDEPDGYGKLVRDVLIDRARRLVAEYGTMEAEGPARGGRTLGAEHRAEWERLAVDPAEFDAGLEGGRAEPLTQVGPLLTTAWHQNAPYNNLCPMGDGGRTVVGCVATATAQILRYHVSPFAGFGSHCYYWSGDTSCGGSTAGQTLCAYYDDEYDWANMPNSCGTGCSTEEQDALAELCYEVGVAFNMGYGHCGSGAYTADALNVFPTYFGYSTAIDRENRSAHSASSWFGIIREEINVDRPMQYRILGHSIVCDGWRDTGGTNEYHMNYGWGGSQNAWFVIDNLYGSDDPNDEYLIRRIIPPDAAWEDVTNGAPVGDTGDAMGVAWCDYDDDGDVDLYIANDGTANILARNDGAAAFSDATSGPVGDAGPGAAVVWGDYDNDGDPDVYVTNTGSGNRLFRNDGGGVFADVTAGAAGDVRDAYGAAWADYDLDGDVDLYFANDGASNVLLRNDGAGAFTDVTAGALGDAGPGRGVAWGDYDGDGDPDLYVTNYGSSNVLLRNDGGAFTDATVGPLGDAGNGTGVSWCDYDNDGDLDLYFVNHGSANKLLRNDGGGSFTDVAAGPLNDGGAGTGVAWGDYDLDGDQDAYLVNDGAANRLIRNLGGDQFLDVTTAPLDDAGDGQGTAWGDLDGDGRLDLVLANRNGANALLRGRATNTAHFFHATLEGTTSNRSAIGARVRLVTGQGSQVREVSGGGGYLSQESLTVEFGLGWATEVDTLEIRWPSGIVNVYTSLLGDQFAHFVEVGPPSAPSGLAAAPGEVSVALSWAPVTDPQLDHYRIERDTTAAFGPGTVSFTASDTSYVDFPVVEVREYFYRVIAAGTGGTESEPGETVSASPLQTAPEAPGGLAAVAGDGLVQLSWSASASVDADHYRIERDTTDAFGPAVVSFTTPATVMTDGPLGGGEYFYRVFTVDWGGLESAPSESVSCSPLVVPPSRPQGLVAGCGAGVIELEWDDNPEVDIAGYIVYRDTLTAIDPSDSLAFRTGTTFDDSDVSDYQVYWYCVEAVDLGGLRSVRSDTVAGVSAPGGAVFVDCGYSGYENGTYSYPFNEMEEGIGAASEGAIVFVLPGGCGVNLMLDEPVTIIGMSGAGSTSLISLTGSVVTALAGSDSARLQGLTLDGGGSANVALDCSGSDITVVDCVVRGATQAAVSARDGARPSLVRSLISDSYYGISCADSASPHLSGNVFSGNTLADLNNTGSPGPVVGGALETANDFLGGAYFAVFNTSVTPVVAELNYWGDACVDSSRFYGPVLYTPWTDSLHVETYYECPGTGIDDGFPSRYALGGNRPNPFNPSTRISYDVPAPGGRVSLRVYSVAGALVRELVAGRETPGRHSVVWDGTDGGGRPVSSGVYFYRFEAPDFSERRKMVLLK